jgi:hypothetical protein
MKRFVLVLFVCLSGLLPAQVPSVKTLADYYIMADGGLIANYVGLYGYTNMRPDFYIGNAIERTGFTYSKNSTSEISYSITTLYGADIKTRELMFQTSDKAEYDKATVELKTFGVKAAHIPGYPQSYIQYYYKNTVITQYVEQSGGYMYHLFIRQK